MDVHPPHSPIHGVRDFLIHLLTITAGLLIALSLEALVENLHHRHQREEARETITAELENNSREIARLIPHLAEQATTLQAMQTELRSVRAHQPLVPAARLIISGASLRRSSYDTAITSGALALMPYDDASQFAEMYQMQTIFNSIQVQAVVVTEAPLLGALPDPKHSLAGIESMNPQQLDALEEKISNYRGQVVMFSGVAHELDDKYRKFLPH